LVALLPLAFVQETCRVRKPYLRSLLCGAMSQDAKMYMAGEVEKRSKERIVSNAITLSLRCTGYNVAHPHPGLKQLPPLLLTATLTDDIHRRAILGGILHDYYRKSA
jgi:hypothetical protein